MGEDEKDNVSYEQRLKLRKELEERNAREAAVKAKAPFKSKIGQRLAGALTKAADKAEDLRGKADYVGGQAGRIKKAIAPAKRPKTVKARVVPRMTKAKKLRPIYQQRAVRTRTVAGPDPFDSLLHGHGQASHGGFDDLLYGSGKKGKRRGGDPFKGLI